jgi:hypothetical protein
MLISSVQCCRGKQVETIPNLIELLNVGIVEMETMIRNRIWEKESCKFRPADTGEGQLELAEGLAEASTAKKRDADEFFLFLK